MSELDQRFNRAKDAYQELIDRDFPNFDLNDYLEERIAGEEESGSEVDAPGVTEKAVRPRFGKKFLGALDVSGDGRLGFDDVVSAQVV